MEKRRFIGFDIGGTKCSFVIGNGNADILYKEVFPTAEYSSPVSIMDKYCSIIESVADYGPFEAIGISIGGPLDSRSGTILGPPNLPGWEHVEIRNYIEKRTSIPVFVQNDANACALAEWKFGAGKNSDNMIFLTFGTGIGAGLILNGKLYSGTNDMAGEVGHIRLAENGPVGYGKEGSFEGFCSGGGIRNNAERKIAALGYNPFDQADLSAKNIFRSAEHGNEIAKEIVDECAFYLGRGLSVLIDVLNPECIVIGSIYARDHAMLDDLMMKTIDNEALSISRNAVKIVPAGLGEKLGDVAALSVAINQF